MELPFHIALNARVYLCLDCAVFYALGVEGASAGRVATTSQKFSAGARISIPEVNNKIFIRMTEGEKGSTENMASGRRKTNKIFFSYRIMRFLIWEMKMGIDF